MTLAPGPDEGPVLFRPLKVVAAEDDVLILMNTTACLEDLGHKVLEAGSAEMALDLIREHPDLDLLITDQSMPNMTGLELVHLLAEERPQLPIILATGHGHLDASSFKRLVMLSKPFDQSDLERAIEEALAAREG